SAVTKTTGAGDIKGARAAYEETVATSDAALANTAAANTEAAASGAPTLADLEAIEGPLGHMFREISALQQAQGRTGITPAQLDAIEARVRAHWPGWRL